MTALQAATQKFFSTLQESMVSEQWNIGKHETRSSCLSAGSWFSFEMCQVWTFTLKIQLQKNPEVFQKMLQNFSVAWPKRLLEHGRGTTLFAIPPLSFVNKDRDFYSQPGCWRGCVAIYCTENVGSHGNEFWKTHLILSRPKCWTVLALLDSSSVRPAEVPFFFFVSFSDSITRRESKPLLLPKKICSWCCKVVLRREENLAASRKLKKKSLCSSLWICRTER